MSYKAVSFAASALYFALFACLLLSPEVIYWLFGINGHPSADLLAKRAGMLFLGLAVLSFVGRDAPPSNLRRTVVIAISTTLGGLIVIGVYEFLRGTAGAGIWCAIAGETVFLGLYLNVLFRGRATS